MTFIADSVRVRLDDAEIAIVAKLKNAHMVNSADKLLVKSHKCPRRNSYCGLSRDDFTPSAGHRSAGSLPMIADSISKPTPGVFENMPYNREFERLNEITKHMVDNVRDIAEIADSNDCKATSKASAACFVAPDARQIVQNEAGLSLVA
ncbi:hypothetical protein [Burkholderia anthinoferrum]|uniref:hypothetical protein n=1 Tax=Burkholderia anthinoferrum TaxID=3090833 RepID=UPI0015E36868|nr:hypothetical protein [Burkholderia anthinoferrum]